MKELDAHQRLYCDHKSTYTIGCLETATDLVHHAIREIVSAIFSGPRSISK
jgi:hypothetical protein